MHRQTFICNIDTYNYVSRMSYVDTMVCRHICNVNITLCRHTFMNCISLRHFCQYIHYLFRLLHILASLLSVYTLPVKAIAYPCVTFVSIYITCSGYCISLCHFCQYIHYLLRLLPLAIFPVTYIYLKIHSILFPQT